MKFDIIKKSKKSRARLGLLKTRHGLIETPSFVPVATAGTIKTLTIRQMEETTSQVFICNTFHLHLKPGEKYIRKAGGLHRFMGWKKPLMTDSGGFQVFSLGFGQDMQVGKVLKIFPGDQAVERVKRSAQPKRTKISDDGVLFRSPLNGDELFIGPKESMKMQEQIGADIMFAFDECTPPLATREYIVASLERTHRWEARSRAIHTDGAQALFGIVQGSHFKDLRKASATTIRALGFEGYGIGGDLGKTKTDMRDILRWTMPYLEEEKPRHLLGVGYLEDIERIIKEGVDLFDCTAPSHNARHGIAYTSRGALHIRRRKFLADLAPLDSECGCETCARYTRAFLCHLIRAKEMTGMTALTIHNLWFFNAYVAAVRKKIARGLL